MRGALRHPHLTILGLGIVLLLAYYWYHQPLILSKFGLRTLANSAVPLALAAVGQLAVILTGGVDLSIGGIISLTNCISATMYTGTSVTLALTLLLTLGIGVLCGLLNGAIVSILRLQPVVTTLATSYLFHGLSLYVRPSPGGTAPSSLRDILSATSGYIPHGFVFLALTILLVWRMIVRTRLGQGLYAVGDNELAAYMSGIPVGRVILLSYGMSGLFAALAGIFLTSQTTSGDAAAGNVYTLGAIAAAVLGGASLSGGRGSVIGSILAAFLLSTLLGALFASGISTFYQSVFQGGILLAVLMFGNVRLMRTNSWMRFIEAE